jgi:hypothetical protein
LIKVCPFARRFRLKRNQVLEKLLAVSNQPLANSFVAPTEVVFTPLWSFLTSGTYIQIHTSPGLLQCTSSQRALCSTLLLFRCF